MASKSFRLFVEEELGTFPHFIVYAVLEWILIILLFMDGFLAFLSNEFAKFFELHSPCLICTRFDHLLVHRNPNFYYNDSICEGHKKDISSLAYCHVHRKLSDIRNMCEGCLLSFATEKESDTDGTYKSLVGILHKDKDCFVEEDQKIFLKSGKKDAAIDGVQFEKNDVHRCSCCGDPLKVKPSSSSTAAAATTTTTTVTATTNTYARSTSIRSLAPAPSPRASIMWRTEDGKNLDLLHIRYPELKFISDHDPELPEDEYGLNAEIKQSREDVKSAAMPLLADSEEITDESLKTPSFIRGNRFFGIPLSDSASASPRFSNRLLPRKIPLEKSNLISDPNDLNLVSNEGTEGDSLLHHLKRQARSDRNSLIALYMELDEERSASTVAANNAMAMITRLQAEKAAVQMEALQYQRMMEEQAEYDQEALQVLKDLLEKKDEDIKALETDLDAYRDKYGEIKKVGSDDCEADGDDYQDIKSQSISSFGEKSDCGSPTESMNLGENEGNSGRLGDSRTTTDVSSLDFESERSHLFGMLTNLEQKIKSTSSEEKEDQENEVKGHDNKATLTREVSLIRERLRAIEAESGFLKHTAMTLQKGGEGTKLLTEIAQHLRKLRRSDKMEETSEDA